MQFISIGDLKTNFSSVLEQIKNSGEKFVIEYGKKHQKIAVIVPYDESIVQNQSREFGICENFASVKINNFDMSEEELLEG
ncbi:MAG: Unknown protein [uncultured Campylobacterales bacterium]|uniref:Uncharacterized protein n=1 Tax=uncultured Campylobacterales bacterium TaxID=352960 RepID=A0A6S6SM39_9BACT|nr:MAG: Unknown protein [uncultured Campylobacterales bacterium]